MGGPGSGRLFRWDRQLSLDECLSIDICAWKAMGLLANGRSFFWSWSCLGKRAGQVLVLPGDDTVTLSYRINGAGESGRSVCSTIMLTHTPCYFGGQRVWFLCPRCGARARKLYLSTANFLCRRCCDLPYASQQETPLDRAYRKASKLRRRLEESSGLGDKIRPKPKGMHWRTFEKLRKRIETQDQVAEACFIQAAKRLFGQEF